MSLTIEVSLISGRSVSVEVQPDECVHAVQLRAQRALGVRKGRLLNSCGDVLDGEKTGQ